MVQVSSCTLLLPPPLLSLTDRSLCLMLLLMMHCLKST